MLLLLQTNNTGFLTPHSSGTLNLWKGSGSGSASPAWSDEAMRLVL
jgi:hypothetical protein